MQTNVQPEAFAPMSDGVVIRTEGLTKVYDTGVKAVDALGVLRARARAPRPHARARPPRPAATTLGPAEKPPGRGRPRRRLPSEAKALMGVVSQTNTLDRCLTVW